VKVWRCGGVEVCVVVVLNSIGCSAARAPSLRVFSYSLRTLKLPIPSSPLFSLFASCQILEKRFDEKLQAVRTLIQSDSRLEDF